MAEKLDLKLVVKNLANGTLGENLCRICLAPLPEHFENIYTQVCKEEREYCIADVLKELCDMKFLKNDHFNVCSHCFLEASNAYKFYLNAKRNDDILNIYADQLQYHIDLIDGEQTKDGESLCISLPVVTPEIQNFDYDVKNIISNKSIVESNIHKNKLEIKNDPELKYINSKVKKEKDSEDDELIVVISEKRDKPVFFKILPDGTLQKIEYDDKCKEEYKSFMNQPEKKKRIRQPMTSKRCTRCPVEYRFIAKLKEHMWSEHKIELMSCKICEALIEGDKDYQFHIRTHTNIYECDICGTEFRKRETMISHIKHHQQGGEDSMNAEHVCMACGAMFSNIDALKSHNEIHDVKKFTCYYCGRMYKKEIGFNNHIRKHEQYIKTQEMKNKQESAEPVSGIGHNRGRGQGAGAPARDFTCELCGRSFLGQRALEWHRRLHTNERPFPCEICGRAFVSLNRRNQHALCAHTAPARRCPLCPALFHMRSMVNTHIRKVHLRQHKRRARAARPQPAGAGAAPVPLQELSVDVQANLLELRERGRRPDLRSYVFIDEASIDG